MSDKSVFQTLSEIDVRPYVKSIGNGQDFIPWSICVREVSKVYPDFTWEFTSFDGLPFLATTTGFYVECSVTIDGITRKQMRPVYNFGNRANMEPQAGDIDKAQQRALAKAIALHGFGLELWAGEDFEVAEARQEQREKAVIETSEKWKNETLPSMLAEYESLTTVHAVTTLNAKHTREAMKIGDKGAVKALANAKDNRIKTISEQQS